MKTLNVMVAMPVHSLMAFELCTNNSIESEREDMCNYSYFQVIVYDQQVIAIALCKSILIALS